jgi:hypothetical protein
MEERHVFRSIVLFHEFNHKAKLQPVFQAHFIETAFGPTASTRQDEQGNDNYYRPQKFIGDFFTAGKGGRGYNFHRRIWGRFSIGTPMERSVSDTSSAISVDVAAADEGRHKRRVGGTGRPSGAASRPERFHVHIYGLWRVSH